MGLCCKLKSEKLLQQWECILACNGKGSSTLLKWMSFWDTHNNQNHDRNHNHIILTLIITPDTQLCNHYHHCYKHPDHPDHNHDHNHDHNPDNNPDHNHDHPNHNPDHGAARHGAVQQRGNGGGWVAWGTNRPRGTSQHHGHDHHDDYHVDHDQFDDDQQVHPSSQLPSYPGMFPAYKVVPGTSYEVNSWSFLSPLFAVFIVLVNIGQDHHHSCRHCHRIFPHKVVSALVGREGRLLARWRVQEQDDGDNEADCDQAVVSWTLELFDH